MSNTIYESIIKAINEKERLVMAYFSDKEQRIITRNIVPLDYAPRYKPNSNELAADWKDFFHFFDLDGSGGGHLSLKELSDIKEIKNTGDYFDPKDFVTLPKKHPWNIVRDWGIYS